MENTPLKYALGVVRKSPKLYEPMLLYYIYKDKYKGLTIGKTKTTRIGDIRRMKGTEIYEVLPQSCKIHIVQVVKPDVVCNNFLVCIGVVRSHPVIGEPMIVKYLKNDFSINDLNIFGHKTSPVATIDHAPGTTFMKVLTTDNRLYIVKVVS